MVPFSLVNGNGNADLMLFKKNPEVDTHGIYIDRNPRTEILFLTKISILDKTYIFEKKIDFSKIAVF